MSANGKYNAESVEAGMVLRSADVREIVAEPACQTAAGHLGKDISMRRKQAVTSSGDRVGRWQQSTALTAKLW